MATETRPDTPTVLQGACACDAATDAAGAFGDWAEEALFGLRTAQSGGHWQFAPADPGK